MWKDSETHIDLLDFDYLIGITKDIIMNDDLSPSTIGMYGDWGSGKSSLMEMTMKELEANEDYLCLKFNGWLFEGYEDAKTALIGTILDEINKKKKLSAKAKETIKKLYKKIDFIKLASKGVKYGIDFAVTGGIGTIADITLNTLLDKVQKEAPEITEDNIKEILKTTFTNSEIRANLKSFQEDFADLLKETKIKRLVVFIDELDRCNPDTILETFEAIRLFLFAPGTSFIIGADERQVMYAVQKKYPNVQGNKLDIGKEYLEKIIQYPVKIPQLGTEEVRFYITCLLFKHEIKDKSEEILEFIKEERRNNFLDFKITYNLFENKYTDEEEKIKDIIALANQLSAVLSKGLNGNPRHCKRFLNSLSMRIKMAEIKGVELDKKVLSKLMLLEYFKDSVFKKIGEMQAIEQGKPKELDMIENDQWDEVEKLKLWKDDDWFHRWSKIEPKLNAIDLQPYFYFTRESLQFKNISEVHQLSIDAENILTKLLSGSDSGRQEALRNASAINDFEASQILKVLIQEVESTTEISSDLFKSFISWGSTNVQLHNETIVCLNSIPANNIKASFIPRIKQFAEEGNKLKEIKELFDKWKTENTKLKIAINTEIDN